jgi:hypothetical protein
MNKTLMLIATTFVVISCSTGKTINGRVIINPSKNENITGKIDYAFSKGTGFEELIKNNLQIRNDGTFSINKIPKNAITVLFSDNGSYNEPKYILAENNKEISIQDEKPNNIELHYSQIIQFDNMGKGEINLSTSSLKWKCMLENAKLFQVVFYNFSENILGIPDFTYYAYNQKEITLKEMDNAKIVLSALEINNDGIYRTSNEKMLSDKYQVKIFAYERVNDQFTNISYSDEIKVFVGNQ